MELLEVTEARLVSVTPDGRPAMLVTFKGDNLKPSPNPRPTRGDPCSPVSSRGTAAKG